MKSALLAFDACRNPRAARRAFRKGWRKTTDLINEGRDYVAKAPFKCLGAAAGAAFAFGTAAGWLINRR
jgi:ElaB/YqjD/DUF883 family membrane-anchored ribosome-binding protein